MVLDIHRKEIKEVDFVLKANLTVPTIEGVKHYNKWDLLTVSSYGHSFVTGHIYNKETGRWNSCEIHVEEHLLREPSNEERALPLSSMIDGYTGTEHGIVLYDYDRDGFEFLLEVKPYNEAFLIEPRKDFG